MQFINIILLISTAFIQVMVYFKYGGLGCIVLFNSWAVLRNDIIILLNY